MNCADRRLAPPTTWISGIGLTSLYASWEAVYTNKISMPDRKAAPYVENSPVPIGVTDSSLLVTYYHLSLDPSTNTYLFLHPPHMKKTKLIANIDHVCIHHCTISQFNITLYAYV